MLLLVHHVVAVRVVVAAAVGAPFVIVVVVAVVLDNDDVVVVIALFVCQASLALLDCLCCPLPSYCCHECWFHYFFCCRIPTEVR